MVGSFAFTRLGPRLDDEKDFLLPEHIPSSSQRSLEAGNQTLLHHAAGQGPSRSAITFAECRRTVASASDIVSPSLEHSIRGSGMKLSHFGERGNEQTTKRMDTSGASSISTQGSDTSRKKPIARTVMPEARSRLALRDAGRRPRSKRRRENKTAGREPAAHRTSPVRMTSFKYRIRNVFDNSTTATPFTRSSHI